MTAIKQTDVNDNLNVGINEFKKVFSSNKMHNCFVVNNRFRKYFKMANKQIIPKR